MTALAFILAVVCSIALGAIDLGQTEVQGPVACALVFGFILGCVRPRSAWRWAIMLGVSVSVTHLLARWAGWKCVYPTDSTTPAWALLA